MSAIACQQRQFVSGPQSYVFYACPEHRSELDKPWLSNELFYAVKDWPVVPVDVDEDYACDFCREGGYE